jgi:hypothetical protein
MDVVQDYLRLVGAYCQYLGGLRWSSVEDAIEHHDGHTFAFNEEIALFLEGWAAHKRLVHFGHVLHLLSLLRDRRAPAGPGIARLRRAFIDAGRPLRNAGAFAAILCRDVPEVPEAVAVQGVCDRLPHPLRPIRWFVSTFHDTFAPAEWPPLGPAAFEQQLDQIVAAYSDEELRDWLRHGRGPVRSAAAALAREMVPPAPRTLTGALEAALERPRLSGVRPFVGQLVSALALPPRRLARQEFPIGGYADVTTHGHPDQILLSQFALDEWDFFRRFAERELLYFRREEPHTRVKQEVVVLLDQGVRTWGDVRLVLGAAVLAFGNKAERRGLPFLLATTGAAGGPIDPLQAGDEALADLLEASDLSPHPGLALEGVLEQTTDRTRDVILLTHARSLREPDVSAAARRVRPGVRLFTLALDGQGEAEFSEVRHGTPVPLRRFHVDFKQTLSPAPPQRARAADGLGPWQGDVEPIGYPFRLRAAGAYGRGRFDFDYAGEWLLAAGRDGMLHAWKADGSQMEVLPRGIYRGTPLNAVDAVVGVAGGFAVIGSCGRQPVIVHYDWVRRTGIVHPWNAPGRSEGRWGYSRQRHALRLPGRPGKWFDLGFPASSASTGAVPASGASEPRSLTDEGGDEARAGWLEILNTRPGRALGGYGQSFLYLDGDSGEVTIQAFHLPWRTFTPLADGRPLLRGCLALTAQCRADILALRTIRLGTRSEVALHLFRLPDGVPLATYALTDPGHGFVLSTDGQHLCRQVEDSQLEIVRTEGGARPVFRTAKAVLPRRLQLRLGKQCLLVCTDDRHYHVLRWDRARLEVEHRQTDPGRAAGRDWPGLASAVRGTRRAIPEVARYDEQRFILGVRGDVLVAGDRFGQVAIFDCKQELVCMVFAVLSRMAAWMPNGTCQGPDGLTGRPATPDALEKIGRALHAASLRGGATPCT